jgi:oligopeptide transport system substrate-binding protein
MKRIFILIPVLLLFVACNISDSEKLVAKGEAVYGGKLIVNENHEIISLHPHAIGDLVSAHVASQIFEGLVKFDPKTLAILPSLAEKWEIDESGTIYTFNLKKGAFFHDDNCFPQGKGREVKASDVQFSIESLCSNNLINKAFSFTLKGKLKGCEEFYENKAQTLEGFKLIDEYTFQLILEKPHANFLSILAQVSLAIIPREAAEKYNNLLTVGTGPFLYNAASNSSDKIILTRNSNYHRTDSLGNKLPFLDSLIFTFNTSKQAELDAFYDREIDLIVGLPSHAVKDVVEKNIKDFQTLPPKFILDRTPELVTHFLILNVSSPALNNVKVRQALNFAVDRNRLYNDILKGEAFGAGLFGISPPSLTKYDVASITGYTFDPVKARNLLAEAGYPNGKGFPVLRLVVANNNSRNTKSVLEISKQLNEVLKINVDVEVIPYEVSYEAMNFGRGDMFKSSWIADYPDPENFLSLFHGKSVPLDPEQRSFPNSSRYINPVFDSLINLAQKQKDKAGRYKIFLQAEQIMMDDAPAIVLWYDEKYRLYQSDIHNFFPNSVNYWDFSEVYRKPFTP